jgi:hypothetical protein
MNSLEPGVNRVGYIEDIISISQTYFSNKALRSSFDMNQNVGPLLAVLQGVLIFHTFIMTSRYGTVKLVFEFVLRESALIGP